jgi:hypothetical protein
LVLADVCYGEYYYNRSRNFVFSTVIYCEAREKADVIAGIIAEYPHL